MNPMTEKYRVLQNYNFELQNRFMENLENSWINFKKTL